VVRRIMWLKRRTISDVGEWIDVITYTKGHTRRRE
jgi:hypothetical protein